MKKCGDCYYMPACQLWNRGSMINTNADECLMYTTLIETSAFYLGYCYGKKDRWIPVEKALPETDDWMLVTVEDKLRGKAWVERAKYSQIGKQENWIQWNDGKWVVNNVSAWMKIPDAYFKPQIVGETPIRNLNLDTRCTHILLRYNIETIEKLEELSEDDLKTMRGMGEKCLAKIKAALKNYHESLQKEASQ